MLHDQTAPENKSSRLKAKAHDSSQKKNAQSCVWRRFVETALICLCNTIKSQTKTYLGDPENALKYVWILGNADLKYNDLVEL